MTESDALCVGGLQQLRWSLCRDGEFFVPLPLLITMMSYICVVPDGLQSILSCYPLTLWTHLPSGEWLRRGAVVVVGGETTDSATRCCRLTPSHFTRESLLPHLQSRTQDNLLPEALGL